MQTHASMDEDAAGAVELAGQWRHCMLEKRYWLLAQLTQLNVGGEVPVSAVRMAGIAQTHAV